MNCEVLTVSASFLYETVLEGYPAKIVGGRTGVLSPPVQNDTTSPFQQLQLLCARWNKTFVDPYMTEADADFVLLQQNVMNPRSRLWSAAVAYALLSFPKIDSNELAKAVVDNEDENFGYGLFSSRGNPDLKIAVTTLDNATTQDLFYRRYAYGPQIQTMLVASVTMHTKDDPSNRIPDDFYDTDDNLLVTVTIREIPREEEPDEIEFKDDDL